MRRNERFYYKENQLASITYYKYLGIVFSSSLKWSMVMRTIAQQANRAMCVLRDVKYKCAQIPLSVSFELFDKMILPILFYGSVKDWVTSFVRILKMSMLNFVDIYCGRHPELRLVLFWESVVGCLCMLCTYTVVLNTGFVLYNRFPWTDIPHEDVTCSILTVWAEQLGLLN